MTADPDILPDILPKILIVGGGIAGCSAAIALSRAGCSVTLIEKQPEWRFQSSGIFVYSNGLAALRDLGALEGALAAGFAIPGGRNLYLDADGAPITEVAYPRADGGMPAILGLKRADLHRALAGPIGDLGVAVRLGTTVRGLTQTGGAVAVTFCDGSTGSYDLVIGADGLRSQVRALIGIDAAPRYTGFGVWRSVHRRPADLTAKIMMMGRGKRYGIMPISDDRLYTFGTVAEPKTARYAAADWPALMRDRFAEFAGPAAPFLAELGPDSDILYTAVEEVALPLPWHRGRVLLIGDAAHASTPFMGQGGAMAMRDAVVLGRLVAAGGIDAALDAFGRLRQPTCQFVQDASRAVGEAGAVEDDTVLAARGDRMRARAQADVDRFYTRLFGLEAETDRELSALRGRALA